MAASPIRFRPTEATGLACPACGRGLTFTRTCRQALLACNGCGATYAPSQFLDRLGETFEDIYADIPLDRM